MPKLSLQLICYVALGVVFCKGQLSANEKLKQSSLRPLELDLDDPLTLDLIGSWKNIWPSRRLSFFCQTTCPSGVSLSSDGLLHWKPSDYAGPSPFQYFITIRHSSLLGKVHEESMPVIIDRFGYKAGYQWQRFFPQEDAFEQLPQRVKNFQYTTGMQTTDDQSVSLGSVTYLGLFRNEHLIITNFHVYAALREKRPASQLASVARCNSHRQFYFERLKLLTQCKKLIFADPVLDIAIMAITSEDQFTLSQLLHYAPLLKTDLTSSQSAQLVVAGHGQYRNLLKRLSFGFDHDCTLDVIKVQPFDVAKLVVAFGRHLLEPFLSKNRPFIAPRLPIACDLSPGDSGGPVIQLDTGELVGISVGSSRAKPLRAEPGGTSSHRVLASALFIPLSSISAKVKWAF